jgi:hypothetical protein
MYIIRAPLNYYKFAFEKMDNATLKYLALLSATSVIYIIVWIVASCCCWLLTYLYYNPDLKTSDEETPVVGMEESNPQELGEDHKMIYFEELNQMIV